MKRITLTIMIACCALALVAQDAIRVNYKGAKPNIRNFVWAYLDYLNSFSDEEDECCQEGMYMFESLKQAILNQDKGLPLNENETLTIDVKNGYLLYELRHEEFLSRLEMCFWNESDGKHKLFAIGVYGLQNGRYSPGQYDGLTFFRYDNATKTMTRCDDTGFEVAYSENGAWVSYDLPRTGKNITVNHWYDDGRKAQRTLKFDGRRFSF